MGQCVVNGDGKNGRADQKEITFSGEEIIYSFAPSIESSGMQQQPYQLQKSSTFGKCEDNSQKLQKQLSSKHAKYEAEQSHQQPISPVLQVNGIGSGEDNQITHDRLILASSSSSRRCSVVAVSAATSGTMSSSTMRGRHNSISTSNTLASPRSTVASQSISLFTSTGSFMTSSQQNHGSPQRSHRAGQLVSSYSDDIRSKNPTLIVTEFNASRMRSARLESAIAAAVQKHASNTRQSHEESAGNTVEYAAVKLLCDEFLAEEQEKANVLEDVKASQNEYCAALSDLAAVLFKQNLKSLGKIYLDLLLTMKQKASQESIRKNIENFQKKHM